MQRLPAVTVDAPVTEMVWQSVDLSARIFADAGAPPPDIPVIFFVLTGFAPFILLAVTVAAGRWLEQREERLDTGPVRPPGWERDQ